MKVTILLLIAVWLVGTAALAPIAGKFCKFNGDLSPEGGTTNA